MLHLARTKLRINPWGHHFPHRALTAQRQYPLWWWWCSELSWFSTGIVFCCIGQNSLTLTNFETCISQAFDAIASSSGGIQIKNDKDHSSWDDYKKWKWWKWKLRVENISSTFKSTEKKRQLLFKNCAGSSRIWLSPPPPRLPSPPHLWVPPITEAEASSSGQKILILMWPIRLLC